jgi:hypothetical protein
MDGDELAWIAEATGATSARRAERIQSLWSGYGAREHRARRPHGDREVGEAASARA